MMHMMPKGFSTAQCVVDYKNVNCLDKQNDFCIAAAAKYLLLLVKELND